ncbi:MAG: S41 family peptidase [Bryobacteraceae bacterium]
MKKFSVALAFVASSCLFGRQMPNDTARLIAVGRLWVTVNYFDPYIARGNIDWDGALVHALPAIRAAGTPAQYTVALQSMLDALHDPETYVSARSAQPAGTTTLKYDTEPDSTLVISQTSGKWQPGDRSRLRNAIRRAHSIVFDLRIDDPSLNRLSYLLDQPSIADELTPAPLDAPGERTWIHHGLAPMPGFPAPEYYSAFETKAGPRFSGDPATKRHRLVFLIGRHSHLPAIACALAGSGQAAIFSDSAHYTIAGEETARIDMGTAIDAVVRLSEPVFSGGTGLPDAQLTTREHALAQTVAAVSLAAPAAPVKTIYPSPRADRDDAGPAYPSTGYRVLAAYKIWGVFHYFFAYRDQMDDDWDQDFTQFLPKIAAAQNARDYNLAIAEFVTRAHDSQAQLHSRTLAAYFGEASPGIRLRYIEKQPVVTDVFDGAASKAGIQPGDIVLKVDGENISERANREARYIPASTRQSLAYLVLQRILNGPDGSFATLSIEKGDGQIEEVKLKRSKSFLPALRHQRSGEVVKILPGNIGYTDLDRLTPDQVGGMFNRLRNTKAIVFDMRGSTNGTAGRIAARLTDKQDVPAAILTGTLSLAPDLQTDDALTQNATYFLVQKLPRTDQSRYRGQTVMLIDERTIGLAERAGLFLEAANRTRFIGTPSAGADGDVTNFAVPGGIVISLSGLDVRHANGGQLQRIGLQTSVEVAPTIAGIRAGRDEVLEAAAGLIH